MRKHHEGKHGLRWLTVDLSTPCDEQLPEGGFDVVIDKGTFDAMICDCSMHDASANLMINASRVLAPGGKYMIVSLYPPPLLQELLAVPELDFHQKLDVERVPRNQPALAPHPPPLPLDGPVCEDHAAAFRRGEYRNVNEANEGHGGETKDEGEGVWRRELMEGAELLGGGSGGGQVARERSKDVTVVVAHRRIPSSSLLSSASSSSSSPQILAKTSNSQTLDPAQTMPARQLVISAVEEQHRKILQHWFTEQRPLLTPERDAWLRAGWQRRSAELGLKASAFLPAVVPASGSGVLEVSADDHTASLRPVSPTAAMPALDLRDAYEVMFTEAERKEYNWNYFMEDVESFGPRMKSTTKMEIDEATDFLRENQ